MPAPLYVRTDGNQIFLEGALAVTDFRKVIAAIYTLTHYRGYQDICLNFERCSFVQAPPMIALICECMRQRENDIDFSLTLPRESAANRLFLNSDWAHFIDPDHYQKSTYTPLKHNPAKRFVTADQQATLVNEVMDTLLANFTGFSRSHLKAIEWSLNEITDNVMVHAQSLIGGVIQVTAERNRQRVEFIVGDSGIGVATSLRMGYPEISSDVDALSKAIQEGVTRDIRLGQGNGLYGSYRLSVSSSGRFSINSNYATLYFAESAGMHIKKEEIPFHGSLVTCCMDYSNPLLLDQVLRFSDQPHDPVDMIELKYESDDHAFITFRLAAETASVGSRIAGAPVRTKLLNLREMCPGRKIMVDFDGVQIMSSSFADEVFGKIFIAIGPLAFSTTFQFRNLDVTVRKLIDKAIMQRAAVSPLMPPS
jgi:anti-sigma regulatory factor (Ser/Thr protein kinase)